MTLNTMIGVAEEKRTYPGYLFSQFIIKEKDTNEDLALLSILDKEDCLITEINGVNSNAEEFEDYLDGLRIWNSDIFFDMLKAMSELLIDNDIFNIKFCPILHTLIPLKDLESGIIGTLSDTPNEESTIQWSLVNIK